MWKLISVEVTNKQKVQWEKKIEGGVKFTQYTSFKNLARKVTANRWPIFKAISATLIDIGHVFKRKQRYLLTSIVQFSCYNESRAQ